MIRIGIIGGSGFIAGEICRLLINHPESEIIFVNSYRHPNCQLCDIHEGLHGETDLIVTNQLPLDEVDVVFCCPETDSSVQFLSDHYIPADVRIIDVAPVNLFNTDENDYIYGLPEVNAHLIGNALHVDCPSALSTVLQLSLLPLAETGMLQGNIYVSAMLGSTATGISPEEGITFSNQTNNISLFEANEQDILTEVGHTIHQLQPDCQAEINLVSHRANFARGIYISLLTECHTAIEEVESWFRDFYCEKPFTHYSESPVALKQVINTNKCLIHAAPYRDKLLVTACIDNLLKGGAGQAIQNMNLMFGLEETTGLRLKATTY